MGRDSVKSSIPPRAGCICRTEISTGENDSPGKGAPGCMRKIPFTKMASVFRGAANDNVIKLNKIKTRLIFFINFIAKLLFSLSSCYKI
ncbi:MAG: hypothetical protein RRA35_12780, partial [Desulfomonilia bacterium]|nr:hypothetical protein [Desulfomonilia bacterium]